MFRAIILGRNNIPYYVYPPEGAKWFTFKGSAYRIDNDSVCQVLNKGNRIKPLTEAIYMENSPVPLRSKLEPKTLTDELLTRLFSKATNKPAQGFLETLLHRS